MSAEPDLPDFPPGALRSDRLRAESDLSVLDKITAWSQDFLAPRADRPTLGGKLTLAIEEIFVNVVEHGYPVGETGVINLGLFETEEGVTVVIEDAAPAFDPFQEAPDADVDSDLEAREIGGLGLFMVRELADRVSYERRDGRNRVTVFFQQAEAGRPLRRDRDDDPTAAFSKASLGLRFAALFVAVFLASLACAGALNFFKFERAYMETAERRYDAVLRETRSTIETSLGAGLTLAANRSTQVVLDNVAAEHDGAVALTVYDAAGEIIFRDQGQGEDAPPSAFDLDESQEEALSHAVVHTRGEGGLTAATAIHLQEETVGYLVAAHDAATAESEVARLRETLLRSALLVAAVFTPLLALAAWLAIRPLEQRHRRISDALRLQAQGRDEPAPEDEYGLTTAVGEVERLLRVSEKADAAPRSAP